MERFCREYMALSEADRHRLRAFVGNVAKRYRLEAEDIESEAQLRIMNGADWPQERTFIKMMRMTMVSVARNRSRTVRRESFRAGGGFAGQVISVEDVPSNEPSAEDNIIQLQRRAEGIATILSLFDPGSREYLIARRYLDGCSPKERRQGMTDKEYWTSYRRVRIQIERYAIWAAEQMETPRR